MQENEQHLKDLTEIRQLMERSSRFLSLSGFSGILVGIFALIGAAAAYWYLDMNMNFSRFYDYTKDANGQINKNFYIFFFTDALMVLAASLGVAYYFSSQNAKKLGDTMWNGPAKRMILNLLIPLITGGIFCLIMVYHGYLGFVAPSMLLFYGLALINSSKYTYDDIRTLGFCEIALGLLATFFIGYGLLFWSIGFGILHIIYGVVLYTKYEK